MYEDDRIRVKNKVSNEAFELIEGLRNMGYSDDEIVQYAQFASAYSDNSRTEIYYMMVSTIGRINEKSKDTSGNS